MDFHILNTVPVAEKFSLDKSFVQPRYLSVIAEILSGISFTHAVKIGHRVYVFLNTGQTIHGTNISPMRAGGEKGENFRPEGKDFWLIL